ncbi:protein furry homolog-like isoform X2 [Ostrea edulis]|uniref:protein furry homolog-like isoform X2 n=1 Tax=Ostrea edulis TaxID=37623 RepID=UPI0024AF63F9|nr:protein furry homolog-like isoform X2 [Ostrea edulis]
MERSHDNGHVHVIRFPWRRDIGRNVEADPVKPGEYTLQTLFLQFCSLAEKKVEQVVAEPLEKPLAKSLQRGEDSQFDQILGAMGIVAEQSLPSILQSLFAWFEKQNMIEESSQLDARQRHRSKGSKDFLCERRDLAVEFVYCLVLIEVLAKLNFHPGYEELVVYIIKQAFRHFKYKDGIQANPNSQNIGVVADLYAEVIGVLAQSRFQSVKKHFVTEWKELKLRDQTPYTAQSIISLLNGLKYFRVKMHPIEEFEACVSFLHDLGHYFLDVKDREIKHALALLFVDILLPVAATAKNEVNVPVLKNLVEMLYAPVVDMTTKKKHSNQVFPLVTCLLCVSQKQFFLTNWPYFLTTCLSHLKSRDPKSSRMALDSLHRLLWVYMVRIKCESNSVTHSRLQSIFSSLFPKGSKVVTPKDVPLNYFVKMIQFIAKERLDFAMKEIIFDLLCVGRPAKIFLSHGPERMSIGLRAFLVIADSLQQKDGDPPMPQSQATLPSGSTVRVKRTFLNKMLTDTTAKTIGIAHYYPHILKAFDSMLRALDLQVGRQLLQTKIENVGKEPEVLMGGERKAKIELFRTCIAAIPRLIPDGMSAMELVEMLNRLTVHVDDTLKGHAFQALQNLMLESPSWRENVIRGFVMFIQKEISDVTNQLLDSSLRLLMQLLVQWKASMNMNYKDKNAGDGNYNVPLVRQEVTDLSVLHEVEGLALVMMCSARVVTRKLAVHLLKEVRNIFNSANTQGSFEPCLLEMIDRSCGDIIKRLLPSLPHSEKSLIMTSSNIDLTWIIDRAASVWNPTNIDPKMSERHWSAGKVSPWMRCVAMFVSSDFGMTVCPHAVGASWPIVFSRLSNVYALLEPSTMINENRTSLLRSGTSNKKPTTEKDLVMELWQNYVILACAVAQKGIPPQFRCASPDPGSSPDSAGGDSIKNSNSCSATALFQMLIPLMKCENIDMRDTIVNGLGYTNPAVFRELMDELVGYLKEAIDRKEGNFKRRRKKDVLRVQLAHIFELMAANKTFAQADSGVIDKEEHCLNKMFVEYIDGARQYLESESDRNLPDLQDIRLHFSRFVRELISNTPMEYKRTLLTRDLRYSLFHLFGNWSGKFSHTMGDSTDRRVSKEEITVLELSAVKAMSAVLCCGPVFDPNGLNDDGYIYQWAHMLLSSHEDRIYELAKETVVLLLDFNPDTSGLLDWVIDRCYTGAYEVADGCFNALAAVFQSKEYPCDHVAMLNLALLNVGSPRMQTHETAVQLLHLLDTRFFQEPVFYTESTAEDVNTARLPLNDIFLSVSYCHAQMSLSEQLAKFHPEITLDMFSEITHRFQTAKPSVRQTLLRYLLPWLHNMELVDPSLPQASPLSNFLTRLHDNQVETYKPPLKGEGWGSPEATKMVLNNLFYITVKFGDDHYREIEELWAALVIGWPNNLRVIIHYLVILTNMAAAELLPFAKRVVSYLGRARPERLVDELMNELQTVETLNMTIERTQTPPYFRLSQIKRNPITVNTTDDEKLETHPGDAPLEKGTLHTKRHSANEDLPSDSTPQTESTTSLRSVSSTSSSQDQFLLDEEIHLPGPSPARASENRRSESPVPYPLPMPAYGGYFAPLSEYLPESLHPTPGFHRSNIAVMFLSDLVLDGLEIDWSAHLPLMLHVIFLGLDHMRAMVYEHCKKLLENLILLASAQEGQNIARMLLGYRSNISDTLKLIAEDREGPGILESSTEDPISRSTISVESRDSNQTLIPDVAIATEQLSDPDSFNTVEDIVKAILDFMESRRGRPLWSCEDITPRTLKTQSAYQLEFFLKCVVKCFKELSPIALVEQRWSHVALQLALSCSSRHYAGRSFQVLRALHIRPTTQMLSDILSRLVETVAEQGEDMQGYVTEIILTLEAAVDNLDIEMRPIDYMREIFMSTPNLAKEYTEGRKGSLMAPRQAIPHHARSTSYSVTGPPHRSTHLDLRFRASTDIDRLRSNIPRSRSAQSLKNADQGGTEDKLTIVAQMFWIAVSLLESDYEYEFLLAVQLLQRILQHIQPERSECRERLEKIQQQIKWTNFPGVQTLLLKGFTSSVTMESVWSLLSRLTISIAAPVVDPTEILGFPINVIALLPVLVQNYENPSQKCRDAADHIVQICSQKSERLNNLGTVMSLYSRGTFGKDSFQWTKCVIKYVLDVYATASLSMISFLVEVLEKGPNSYQSSVFQILHCMVHYIDISSPSSSILNSELVQVISRHVEGSHCKEALKILKLAVTRSSTLAAAPLTTTSTTSHDYNVPVTHTSFAEAEMFLIKKELPGRTLDFSVDIGTVPIVGRNYINTDIHGPLTAQPASQEVPTSPTRKSSGDGDSCWRKPQSSQPRVRERLAELLTCYGQKRLPKSPSDTVINKVIFSQSSDTLDHQQSVASSGEETSTADGGSSDIMNEPNVNDINLTIKGFDFLNEEDSEDNDYYSSLDTIKPYTMMSNRETLPTRPYGSVPDLKLLDSLSNSEKVVSPSDSISLKEERMSDDESEANEEDRLPASLPGGTTIVLQNPCLDNIRPNSPDTTSTHSLHSESDLDLVDIGSNSTSPSFSQTKDTFVFMTLQNDEVEDVWKTHITNVMSQSSAVLTVKTSQIFPRLYRELRRRLDTMIKEACYYISKTESLKHMATQFRQIMDMIFLHMECPFFYVDADTLTGSRTVEKHKFSVLEIQEYYETYSMRKDLAEQSLEVIKSSIKQESLGDGGQGTSICSTDQKLELCTKLYRVIFQLVSMFENFVKLMDTFRSVTSSPQIADMSLQVSSLRSEVSQALQEMENGQVSPINTDSSKIITKAEAVTSLLEYINGHQFVKAIQLLRSFRCNWPGDIFGQTSDDDIIALLNIYCASQAEKRTGLFVLMGLDIDLGLIKSQLMQLNIQMRGRSSSVPSLTPRTPEEEAQQDSSSL